MAYQADEITILKDSEFTLLLAAAGIGRWYGIETAGMSELDSDRGFNKNLAELYQKHIIDWKNGKACFAGPYRRIFQVLKESPVCITFESENRPGYTKGCYFSGGDVVTVERRTGAADEIELSVEKYSDWLKGLEDDGIIPDTAGVPDESESIDMDSELTFHIELRSVPDGKLLETAELFDKGLYGVLERTIGKKTETEYFTKEAFIAMMDGWVREE